MTKEQFYKELEKAGVDTKDPIQMKIWSTALLMMGQDFLNHRFDRCQRCYFRVKSLNNNGDFDINLCPNQICPIKAMPDTPGKVVDYIFERDEPLEMSAFFNKYVDPILKRLVEEEQNARNNNNKNT